MADFKTHLIGAAAVSGLASTALISADVAEPHAAVGYFGAGVVGGLLPDVDLDSSIPVKIARRLLTTIGTIMVVLRLASEYSLLETTIVGIVTFYTIGVAFEIFDRYTVHRGLVHSIPSAVGAGLGSALLASRVLGANPLEAWFYCLFVFVGFMVHLVLDETYSVNLLGASFKRSFGSAITWGDRNNLPGTALLYAAVALLWLASPTATQFVETVTDAEMYRTIANNFLPTDGWFHRL